MLMQLRVTREREPSAKALVFSQFASTIEWLKVKLQQQGFGYRTISGSMTLKQRSKVCTHPTAPALLLCTQTSTTLPRPLPAPKYALANTPCLFRGERRKVIKMQDQAFGCHFAGLVALQCKHGLQG